MLAPGGITRIENFGYPLMSAWLAKPSILLLIVKLRLLSVCNFRSLVARLVHYSSGRQLYLIIISSAEMQMFSTFGKNICRKADVSIVMKISSAVFRSGILNAAQMILLIVRKYLQIRAEFAYT